VSATDLVLRLIAVLNELGVPYMLVGSYSSNYYGRARATQDADFVVEISAEQVRELAARPGPAFHVDPQMSFETLTMKSRYVIEHPATAFTIELFLLADDKYNRLRFARRREVEFEGTRVFVPSPEDVVVMKLRWSKGGNRSKDIGDVANVLAMRRQELDLDYVRRWCDRQGTRELLERMLGEAAS
jgi:hypothetical protein